MCTASGFLPGLIAAAAAEDRTGFDTTSGQRNKTKFSQCRYSSIPFTLKIYRQPCYDI